MTFYQSSLLRFFSNIAIIYLLIFPTLCQANPCLPEPGQYKFFSSFSIIDKESINRRKIRERIYINSQRMMIELEAEKIYLQNKILTEQREATNNERRILRQLNKDMKALELLSSDQRAYQDDRMTNTLIEYGINEKHSFGVKIGYRFNKFISYSNRNTPTSGNNINVFLKYKLFDNNRWVLTLQPTLYMDSYGNLKDKLFQEVKVMVGHYRESIAKTLRFSEVGVFGGSCLSNNCNGENSGGISFTEGVKLQSGVLFYNFIQYYTRKIDNKLYNKSVYEQISVAKEIRFGRLKGNNFTLSAGYFFDQSLVDKSFKLSGPIFSLWFNI